MAVHAHVVAATFVTCAACVICIIGLAIPYWIKSERSYPGLGTFRRIAGLWRTCTDDPDGSQCTNLERELFPDWYNAVAAMEILGVLISGYAALLGVLKLVIIKEKSRVTKLAGALALVAGVFMILGIAIFAAKKVDTFGTDSTLHAGFALCIVSAVVSFVGGVLFLVIRD